MYARLLIRKCGRVVFAFYLCDFTILRSWIIYIMPSLQVYLCYFHQEEYVFSGMCLSVCKITQKVINGF